MEILHTVIIDDEEPQRLNIEKMISQYCPNLKIVAQADGVKSGIETIQRYQPDIVFLDIELGDGTGFELLEALRPVLCKIIFITAFDQYAIKAFRFNALDYLLKPVDPEDLCRAAQKVARVLQHDYNMQIENLQKFLSPHKKSQRKIIIKTFDHIYLVPLQDILYCESDSNYTRFFLRENKNIMVSGTLKDYEDILGESSFFRVHKSYLVNLKYITRFERAEGGSIILKNESKIPVAFRKRDELIRLLEQYTLRTSF